jgi:phosphotransferase system enzyme I (PtsI)
MAGSPRALPILLGMGLRSFSMSPAFIPTIRDLARHVKVSEAENLFAASVTLHTPSEIQTLLDDYLRRIRPEIVPFLLN